MLFACYLAGTLWFITVMTARGNAASLASAFTLCVLPFILPDAAKIALAYFLANRLKRFI